MRLSWRRRRRPQTHRGVILRITIDGQPVFDVDSDTLHLIAKYSNPEGIADVFGAPLAFGIGAADIRVTAQAAHLPMGPP